jgi:putative Ca2+/H+ antiporter (TMEM165/GDT1 family)
MDNVLGFFSTLNIEDIWQSRHSLLSASSIGELSATLTTSYVLIIAAEMGDKSQLVCMTLASRHKATPVVLGAVAAFALLNTLAVVFGVAIANWLPEYVVAGTVSVLFTVFGIHSLRVQEPDGDEEVQEKSNHSVFFTTFLLITVAEFGDKTQLAVVALSSTSAPLAVWIGSTAALATTSALGVLAGRTILQKIPLTLLHKISGSIFLVLAVITAYRAYTSYLP